MSTTVRITVDRATIRALLKSSPVEADMLARAKRIATAAGPGMEATSTVGRTRARASVITATYEARRAEASTRRLSSAVRAGA